MALLSEAEQLKYRIAHRKTYLAFCDRCQLLIPSTDLYAVKAWAPRKDKLTFLSPIETDIRCMTCFGIENGTLKVVDGLVAEKTAEPKAKIQKRDMIAPVRRAVLKIFEDEKPKSGYTTAEIILKLYRRSALREYKKNQIAKTLSLMKKFRDLKKKEDKWLVRKEQHA